MRPHLFRATAKLRRTRSAMVLESLEPRLALTAIQDWQIRGVGGGGALFSPSLSPVEPQEMYIASDMGQVFHSTNTGAVWETVDHREIHGSHNSQVEFTSNPLIRYSVDYTADQVRPTKSVDGGVNWAPLTAGLVSDDVLSIAADYNNPLRLLVSDYSTLQISTDGGTSFNTRFTTADGAGIHLAGAFFDGNNIYVGTNQGVLFSNNGGATFGPAAFASIPSGERIVSFAGAKENGTTRFWAVTLGAGDVYGGVDGSANEDYVGIYRVDVGQANWTLSTSGISGDTKPFFVSAAINDIDRVFVAGGSDDGRPTVYRSSNGGASWGNVFQTIGNTHIETGWSGDGGDRSWGYGEYALGFDVAPLDSSRLIVTDLGFAHYSDDGGANWRNLNVNPNDLNPADANIVAKQPYRSSGLENTTSWGLTWTDPTHIIGSFSDIRGAVSADGGNSWSFNYLGHLSNSMYRSVVQPTTGNVYAAVSNTHDMYESTHLTDASIDGGNGSVLFSIDHGANWQSMHNFGHVVTWVEVDPTNINRIYASVAHSVDGGIYVTNNAQLGGASTWTKLAAPPRTEGHAFNLRILTDGTLLATYSGRRVGNSFTASSGVFARAAGEQTWTDVGDPGMRFWTKDVVVDPNDAAQNTWYVSVFSGWGGAPNGLGGLYKTTNRGVSWTRISALDRVNSVTIKPQTPNEGYLTTEVDGLWYSSNLQAANPTFTHVDGYKFMQPMRVFYNPYDTDEVWVTSFGGGLRVGDATPTGSASSVVNKQLFYNQSSFDGNNINVTTTGALNDDTAIATDKTAYAPGSGSMSMSGSVFTGPFANNPASFRHVSSFTRGINGLMIDITGSHPGITASDFIFKTGNNNSPSTWATAAAPTSVTVRTTGVGLTPGNTRVEIIWPNNSIRNTWLEVNVKANVNTGLSDGAQLPGADGIGHIFFFGNRVGDSGSGDTAAFLTTATDEIGARNNPGSAQPITNRFDYNKDGLVTATDQITSRNNAGSIAFLNVLDPPNAPPAPAADQGLGLVSLALASVKAERANSSDSTPRGRNAPASPKVERGLLTVAVIWLWERSPHSFFNAADKQSDAGADEDWSIDLTDEV